MPKFSIDPSDTGDEAVGFDGAKNRACLRVDLMDLPVSILPDPKCTFGPRESRVTAAAGRRDRGEYTASFGIDLLDAILSDLKQVFAIESRSCIGRDIYRAHDLSARRIEGIQLVTRCKPDVLPVIANSMHAVSSRERAILLDDFSI
jgi:hypothetical protein